MDALVAATFLLAAPALAGEPADARPADSAQPAPSTLAVSIPSDAGVVLAGTLRIPAHREGAAVPLAIFVQGHGPNGRGGFDRLMASLLARGIATLDYDKRGVGGSTGVYVEDDAALTRDAVAAVAAMRRHTAIDGNRIALIGHSQGGAIIPTVAAGDPRIAAIVTLAGPVGDGYDLFSRSMHDQLVLAGKPEATVAPLVATATDLIRARVAHADAATIAQLRHRTIDGFVANGFSRDAAAGALAAIDRDEIYQIARTRIATHLKALRIPVLQVFGALDPFVPGESSARVARAVLADNPAAKVVVFDGMSHWMKDGAVTGSEAENETLGANAGSPRVIALVDAWLTPILVGRRQR